MVFTFGDRLGRSFSVFCAVCTCGSCLGALFTLCSLEEMHLFCCACSGPLNEEYNKIMIESMEMNSSGLHTSPLFLAVTCSVLSRSLP